jgi:hypothetical protein
MYTISVKIDCPGVTLIYQPSLSLLILDNPLSQIRTAHLRLSQLLNIPMIEIRR